MINISRSTAQTFGLCILALSAALIPLGYHVETGLLFGIAVIILMLTESFLLQKVQNEMSMVLEKLREKQDAEVQDLLYFLRRSNIAADPFHSLEAAKIFINKLTFPAFIMSPDMSILKSNKHLTKLLGYENSELDGWPVARINNIALMSHVGGVISSKPYHSMSAMHLRYFYLHKTGTEVPGTLAVTKIIDGAYMMVFHPDCQNVITEEYIKNLS